MNDLLGEARILMHPFVIGEIALGSMRNRTRVLADLHALLPVHVASTEEVEILIEEHRLYGIGIGYVDVHLLAATRLTDNATLWTRDKRLHAAAERLGVAARMTN